MDIQARKKILYIEDKAEARALVGRLLSDIYIVLEAGTSIHGLELAREVEPDLILLDINLPDMSGREVATRLRKLLPETPLIALTADATRGARERALVAGCDGYLTKPIDVDRFPDQIAAFLEGSREKIEEGDTGDYRRQYQEELVEHLESKVRELATIADRNEYLNEQNKHVIAILRRQKKLLEAAARVGHTITSILDLAELLKATVEIIGEEYEFQHCGIFLLDSSGEWLTLHARQGETVDLSPAERVRVKTTSPSVIGSAIRDGQAAIAQNLLSEKPAQKGLHLRSTRSEIALPLKFKDRPIGALNVQSDQPSAFSVEDIAALQALADQVAVAIQNARALQALEDANRELVRSKTSEAIANTTGEAIHWVANKAAPIPGSVVRVREDIAASLGVAVEELPESLSEDLEMIEVAARTILKIKEDLIGPARQQHPEAVDLQALVKRTLRQMGIPPESLRLYFAPGLPQARADAAQIETVVNNLVKNAWEALSETSNPLVLITAQPDEDPAFICLQVADNGPGITPENMEKIWVSFFTTKARQGGTGLGLAACTEVIRQAGGKIWAESVPGQGARFTVLLPVWKGSLHG